MKILHVADLHARQPWLDWVAEHATEYDLLCIAGDLQDAFASEGMVPQAQRLRDWLLALPTPTVVCTGNHDWWPRDERVRDVYAEGGWLRMLTGEGSIVAVDGGTAKVGGIIVAAIGWAAPAEWPPGTDVVVCHTPPAGPSGLCRVTGHDFGDYEFRRQIQRLEPSLVLSGHVHHPHRHLDRIGRTLALNPGCDLDAALPAYWAIDTGVRIAELRRADQVLMAVDG